MITFTIGCGVGILIGFVMFAFLSANRDESLVRELVSALRDIVARAENPALCDDTDALLGNARAAIQKAEPKQP